MSSLQCTGGKLRGGHFEREDAVLLIFVCVELDLDVGFLELWSELRVKGGVRWGWKFVCLEKKQIG